MTTNQKEMVIPSTETPPSVILWNFGLSIVLTLGIMLVIYLATNLLSIYFETKINTYVTYLTCLGSLAVPFLLSSNETFRNSFHKEIPQYHAILYIDSLTKEKRTLFEGDNVTKIGIEDPERSEGMENFIHLKTALTDSKIEKIPAKGADGSNEAGIIMDAEIFVAIRPNVYNMSYKEADRNIKLYNSTDLGMRIHGAYGFAKQLFSSYFPTQEPVTLTNEVITEKAVLNKYAEEISAYEKNNGLIMLIHLFNSNPEREVQDILDKKAIFRASREAFDDLTKEVEGRMGMSKKEAEIFVSQVYAGTTRIKFDVPKGTNFVPFMGAPTSNNPINKTKKDKKDGNSAH